MKLYHKTYAAEVILSEGFRDGTGSYLTRNEYSGIWLSNTPLDENEGAEGDTLLVIEIGEEAVRQFEWIEELKPYREFLVPADVVNSYGSPTLVEQDEY